MDKKEIRRIERNWRRSFNKGEKEMNPLKQHLENVLPPYMVPSNVGSYTDVTWPYLSTVSFDFGANPVWGPNTRQTKTFTVPQEGGLLLYQIYSHFYGYNTASAKAPVQMRLIDRQSTRQFNNTPIPLQVIGHSSSPSVFPTPYLFMPNSTVEVEITSWVTADMATFGGDIGKFDLVFVGNLIRIENADNVLSTVFKK